LTIYTWIITPPVISLLVLYTVLLPATMISTTTTSTPAPGTAAAAFDKASEVYGRMTGGCTREVAKFLLTLDPKVDSSSVILDNACGTGLVTEEMLAQFSDGASPKSFAADLAPSMIANIEAKAKSKGWIVDGDGESALTVSVMDAENLSYPDNTFTNSYTNLGFPFFSNGEKAAGHVYRTLRPGGTAFISTWKKLGYLRPVACCSARCSSDEYTMGATYAQGLVYPGEAVSGARFCGVREGEDTHPHAAGAIPREGFK
jgi:ubiquinone/menaquinone biosynthesis C-methylase UbiE